MKKPTGRLFTSNPAGLKHLNEEAEIWQITRGGTLIPGAILVRTLAPSPDLFNKYLYEWKDLALKEWWQKYQEQFLKELDSKEKTEILRTMYKKLLAGTNIVLLCLCKDYSYCHRKLVGEFFAKYNVEVTELNFIKPKSEEPVQLSIFDGVM